MTIPLSAYTGAARFVDLLLSRRSSLPQGYARALVASWKPPDGSDAAFVRGWQIAQRMVDQHAKDDRALLVSLVTKQPDFYRCAKASVTRCYERMKRGK